jgi:ABC-2 type transport system ATP-binding protein
MTTHNIEEAERLCDRIAIIDHGRIVASGAPHELIARSAAAPSVFLATSQPLDSGLLSSLTGVRDVTSEGPGYRFSTADVTRTLAELMKLLEARGIDIAELRVQKATLEDVLIELTREGRE